MPDKLTPCRSGGMEDAADSKSAGSNTVGVRIPPPAPIRRSPTRRTDSCPLGSSFCPLRAASRAFWRPTAGNAPRTFSTISSNSGNGPIERTESNPTADRSAGWFSPKRPTPCCRDKNRDCEICQSMHDHCVYEPASSVVGKSEQHSGERSCNPTLMKQTEC